MAKKPRAACLQCGQECKRSTTKFCSRECVNLWRKVNKIRWGGPQKKLKSLICPECQQLFEPTSHRSKFCSRHCAAMSRREAFIAMAKSKTGPKDLTLEQHRRMSIAASKRNASRTYTKGIGGIRKDIGHYVRSRWEANFCRLLQRAKISYKYEAKSFTLENNERSITYTPDIQLDETRYVEIKGWWDEKSKLKAKLMMQQYPKIKILVVDEPVYKLLSQFYKDEIPGWEHDKNHGR